MQHVFLKHISDKKDSISPIRDIRENLEEDESFDQAIRCVVCGHVITHETEQISINGAHRHVFANPYGLVFETICYKRAMGCVVTGQASDEFSWFPGYQWQVALCGGCFNHLGWRFISNTTTFFCLISDQLIWF